MRPELRDKLHRLVMLWKLHALHRKVLSMSPEQFLAEVIGGLVSDVEGIEVDLTPIAEEAT